MDQCDMHNPLLMHQSPTNPVPPSYSEGSNLLDAIFIPRDLPFLRCGLLGDPAVPDTQHSCPWIDLDPVSLYGRSLPAFVRPDAQRLKVNQLPVLHRFQAEFRRQMNIRNCHARVRRYRERLPLLTEHQRITQWEFIWKDIQKAVDIADRRCSKLFMGAHGFSPDWDKIVDELDMWRARIRQLHKQKMSVRTMLRQARRLGLTHLLQQDEATTLTHLENTLTRKRVYKSQSRHRRDAFNEKLAAAYAAQNNTSLATELQRRNQCERQRIDNRRIRLATKPSRGMGLTKVIGPSFNNPTTRQEYNSREDIERALLDENSSRFQQAVATTPFLNPPLMTASDGWDSTHLLNTSLITGPFHPLSTPEVSPPRYTDSCLSSGATLM